MPEPPKELRLVGDRRAPRPYIDVQIAKRTFQAVLSTGSENSSINQKVLEWVKAKFPNAHDEMVNYIEIPIEMNDVITTVECLINSSQKDDLQLGTHFLSFHDFQFIFNGIVLDSSQSPISLNRNEVSFVYNLPEHQHLRQYLRRRAFFLRPDRNLEPTEVADNNNNRIVLLGKFKN